MLIKTNPTPQKGVGFCIVRTTSRIPLSREGAHEVVVGESLNKITPKRGWVFFCY